jgi:alpha-mannosidase
VLKDNSDAWGMGDVKFRDIVGNFKLMTPQKASEFTSVHKDVGPIRVIEDGPVRTIIEALFNYRDAFIVTRYKIPKMDTEIEIEYRLFWNQKDELLKISIPLKKWFTKYVGQTAYGQTELPHNGNEAVAQKWVSAISERKQLMFSCINDGTYGSDFNNSTMRISLIRSPAYSGHPVDDKPIIPQDRYTPRMDQGERVFRFWFNAGKLDTRLKTIDRDAMTKNEKPFALSFFPSGKGRQILPAAILSDEAITINAIKQAMDNNDWIIRLFEPTGKKRSTVLELPALGKKMRLTFSPFEIKTIRINYRTKQSFETNLLEQKLK